jgi:hypothetical protein
MLSIQPLCYKTDISAEYQLSPETRQEVNRGLGVSFLVVQINARDSDISVHIFGAEMIHNH